MQRILFFFLIASFLWAGEPEQTVRYSKDHLFVKMVAGEQVPSHPSISRVKKLFGDIYVVYTNNLSQLENDFSQKKNIVYTEKDYYGEKRNPARIGAIERDSGEKSFFNDPRITTQWGFLSADKNGISIIDAYENNDFAPKETIVVAVVDTGVDYEHEDLKDIMWSNPGEIPGNGIDDDNNDYIDDIYGINTLVRDENGNATVDMRDAHNHGTHVAGTIAATQNNTLGVAGVASHVKIMGIRTVPNASDELDVDVVEAFLYAAHNGAKVINCSFGKSHNEGGQVVAEAIDHIAKEHGTLVVAAAGNSSRNIDIRPTYPASFPCEGLLVVASTTSYGSMSYFSNYGVESVDVAAPGSSIISTVRGNRYSSYSGTSMASPHTAGVAAHIMSCFPELGPVEVKQVIMDSVTPVAAFSGKIATGGRIDLKKALQTAKKLVSQKK